MGVSFNGGTPISHPKIIILSRNNPWVCWMGLLGKPTIFLETPDIVKEAIWVGWRSNDFLLLKSFPKLGGKRRDFPMWRLECIVFFVADWVGFFFKKHRENGISLPDFEGFFPAGWNMMQLKETWWWHTLKLKRSAFQRWWAKARVVLCTLEMRLKCCPRTGAVFLCWGILSKAYWYDINYTQKYAQ